MLELAHAGELTQVFRRDRDALDPLLENLAQRFAGQSSKFPLERTDTRFTRIIPDQIAQTIFGQFELALFQAMFADPMAPWARYRLR